MKKYKNWQKSLSFFCIFSILFSQTVHLPFFSQASADTGAHRDLVSVIVDSSIYTDSLANQIKTYSQDVQSVYPGVQFLVFPVDTKISPYDISVLNERLYNEWDGENPWRLIGTILVGEVPLPVVENNGVSTPSLFPYTDFLEKQFIYNKLTKKFEQNSVSFVGKYRPEIWHSLIVPNTGNKWKDSQQIAQFFNKTHDFYLKRGVYTTTAPDPYVFYYDGKGEELSARLSSWKLYELGRSLSEDLVYNRYRKTLAETVYGLYQQFSAQELGNEGVSPQEAMSSSGVDLVQEYLESQSSVYGTSALAYLSGSSFSSVTDILSKKVIDVLVKPFYGVFNETFIGNILKYVHNAGRYNTANDVNVDIAGTLVTKQDVFYTRTKKDVNTFLENKIDTLVGSGLSRKVAVLTEYIAPPTSLGGENAEVLENIYTNYFFGKSGASITKAEQCSIVRGSSLVVESNRGYNVNNVQADIDTLSPEGARCVSGNGYNTFPYWGGNSPLNLDMTTGAGNLKDMSLKNNRYTQFTKSAFDMAGSRELTSGSSLHIATPQDCEKTDLLLNRESLACNSPNTKLNFGGTFSSLYIGASLLDVGACVQNDIYLNGSLVTSHAGGCDPESGWSVSLYTYKYNAIPSLIRHTSPTDEEFEAQKNNIITPSMPIDTNRYVDFIGAKWDYQKIEYPNLFRITFATGSVVDEETAKQKLKQMLDEKSTAINAIIQSQNPAWLSGSGKTLYNILSTGAYPKADVNLYQELEQNQTLFKTAIKAILWDTQKYPTEKYAYIFENFLDANGKNRVENVAHRWSYELASIGGDGDAQNLFVGFDPSAKSPDAALAEIAARASAVQSFIAWNKTNGESGGQDSSCGPADGVPIWQWIPAIFCWMKSFLPPKISAGQCGGNADFGLDSGGSSSSWQATELADNNQNGVVDIAEKVGQWSVELSVGQAIVPYATTAALEAKLLDSQSKLIDQDNYNTIHFDIRQIKAYSGGVSTENATVVYSRGEDEEGLGNVQNISRYITFSPADIRAQSGAAMYNFSTLSQDVDVVFDASVTQKDKNGRELFTKNSNNLTVRVRNVPQGLVAKVKENEASQYEASQAIEAGNPYGVMFELVQSEQGEREYGKLQVYDDVSGEKVLENLSVNGFPYFFRDSTVLKKAWVYRFEFATNNGRKENVYMTVAPGSASRLEIVPASNKFLVGSDNVAAITLRDSLGNIASGRYETLKMKIEGSADFVLSSGVTKKEMTLSVIEGVATVTIRASSAGAVSLTAESASASFAAVTTTITAIEYANIVLSIEDEATLRVGDEAKQVNISITDKSGNVIDGFNSYASLNFSSNMGRLSKTATPIKNGKSTESIFFYPGLVGGKSGDMEISVAGFGSSVKKSIYIRAGEPIGVLSSPDLAYVESQVGTQIALTATLVDAYGNTAADTKNTYRAVFTIPDVYRPYLKFADDGYTQTASFSWGVVTVPAVLTGHPWKAYVVVEVTPDLANNAFTYLDDSGKEIKFYGYGKNLFQIQSYYAFNQEKVDKIGYNSLYTLLLGADYGNVSETNYLGGALLFSSGSMALGASSLLSHPKSKKALFRVYPNGKFEIGALGTSATELLDSKVTLHGSLVNINLIDGIQNEVLATEQINTNQINNRTACNFASESDIRSCAREWESEFVFFGGIGEYRAVSENSTLSLKKENVSVVSFGGDGVWNVQSGVEIEADTKSGEYLWLYVKVGGDTIGYIGISAGNRFVSLRNQYSTENPTSAERVMLAPASNRAAVRSAFVSGSTHDSSGAEVIATYASTDASDSLDSADLANYGQDEIEGIGWKGDNKIMLQMAAGANMGDATKFYATQNFVNLGDPFFTLGKGTLNNSTFDSTIGKQVYQENGETIQAYLAQDMDGDGNDDVLMVNDEGQVRVIRKTVSTYHNMGYILSLPQYGKRDVWAGNLDGNAYGDIAYINASGALSLMMNDGVKFSQTQPYILSGSGMSLGALTSLPTRFKIYDMDADGKDDIVILSQGGELFILYATGRKDGENPLFTKKNLEENISVKINTTTQDPDGAITFEGLEKAFKDSNLDSFSQEAEELANLDFSQSGTTIPPEMQQAIINDQLYYTITELQTISGSTLNQLSAAQSQAIFGTEVDTQGLSNTTGIDALSATGGASAVMGEIRQIAGENGTGQTSMNTQATREVNTTYLKSRFSFAENIEVEKKYEMTHTGNVVPGDDVKVTLKITNRKSSILRNVRYLDSYDQNLFSLSESGYILQRDGISGNTTHDFEELSGESYQLAFPIASIGSDQSATIVYYLKVLPFLSGELVVGNLERGEEGEDAYGDVILILGTNCASQYPIWRSTDVRVYERGEKIYKVAQATTPTQANQVDNNGNGTPDYVDYLNGQYTAVDEGKYGVLYFKKIAGGTFSIVPVKAGGGTEGLTLLTQASLTQYLYNANKSSLFSDTFGTLWTSSDNTASLFNTTTSSNGVSITDINSSAVDEIESQIDGFIKKLGCGFGGGACWSSPLNWAPLAPGSVPTLFGYPMGMMTPSTGIPVFSALTGLWTGKACVPTSYPASVLSFPGCSGMGAGGMLGTTSPGNVFRLFITPTITGGIGTAACFGAPAMVSGNIPPKGVSPLVPGGNCVVSAKTMGSCENDNPNQPMEGGQNGFFNANQCQTSNSFTGYTTEEAANIRAYIRGDSSKTTTMNSYASAKRLLTGKTALFNVRMGGQSGVDYSASLDFKALATGKGSIIKFNLPRVSAFPDFIMDWVSRQVEEIVNKLTSLPTLFVILPNLSGIQDAGWKDFGQKLKTAMTLRQNKSSSTVRGNGIATGNSSKTGLGGKLTDGISQIQSSAGLSGVRSAFELISNLPFIEVKNKVIDVPIPDLSPEDMLKYQKSQAMTMSKWNQELESTKASWTKMGSGAYYQNMIGVQAGGLLSSLQYNQRMVGEYAKFPQKLAKLFAWKEKYTRQITCNLDAIENLMGKWMQNNGRRFKAWVQAFQLLKKALETWQVIPDLFKNYKASCSTCRNERYDLKHFMFKLVSVLTPKVPVIQFPKWPDIILDMRDVQLGMTLSMPQFNIRSVPLQLPQLPSLNLPSAPNLGVNFMLPSMPKLPAIPTLPELPDLPSIPLVKLPDLPPPPKIPNIFGSIAGVLNILKIWQKIMCIFRTNPFAPEWRAGDLIAQLTERSGPLPIDFLDLEFPKMSFSFADALRVKTSLRFNFQSDFLTQMAQSIVAPLKQFTPDLTHKFGSKTTISPLGSSVIPSGTKNIRLYYNNEESLSGSGKALKTLLSETKDEETWLSLWSLGMIRGLAQFIREEATTESDVADFALHFAKNLDALPVTEDPLALQLQKSGKEALQVPADTPEMIAAKKENDARFAALKDYLNQEITDAMYMQKEVLKMQNKKAETVLVGLTDSQKFVSTQLAREKQDKVNELAQQGKEKALAALTSLAFGENSSESTSETIVNKSSGQNLLAINTSGNTLGTTSSIEVTSPDSNTTSPQYSWIYVQTREGTVTKLFDYTDEITGDEDIVEIDTEGNELPGALYQMGDGIFVKQNYSSATGSTAPSYKLENTFVQKNITDYVESNAGAVNNFKNDGGEEEGIFFGFGSPSIDKEPLQYRLEYTDHLSYFWQTKGTSGTERQKIIDISGDQEDGQDTENTSYSGIYLSNVEAYFGRAGGSATILYPNFRTLQEGDKILVGQEKELYSGDRSLSIRYSLGNTKTPIQINIEPHQSIRLLADAQVEVLGGEMYLFDEQTLVSQEKDLTSLRGLPLFSGTQISSTNQQGFLFVQHQSGQEVEVSWGQTYAYLQSDLAQEWIGANISENAGMWYARLYPFDKNGNSTRSLPILLISGQKNEEVIDIYNEW